MGEFTKGPWEAVKRTSYDGDYYWLIQTESERNGWELAEVRMDVPDAEGNARVMAAAPALLEALEAVEQEHDLLRWMKNIEQRRRQGSFGIAVSGDSDAIGWQEQAEKLKVLVLRREAAIARARGEA